MTKDLQGSSHHLKVVGGAYGKRLAVVVRPEMCSDCKLRSNGMPVPLLRNCYSIFNGTKYC